MVEEKGGQPTTVLMMRAWNDLEARELPETRNARSPFISPDGRWVGFFGAGEIRRVPVAGGPPESICRFVGGPGGASWGDDDHIVFSSTGLDGLQRVPAKGGVPVEVTKNDRRQRIRHTLPHVLPGSKFVLFTHYDAVTLVGELQVAEIATGTVKTLVPDAYVAAYADTGHLVYAVTPRPTRDQRDQREPNAPIRAVRFDPVRAEMIGEPVTMVDDIPPETNVAASLALSRRGDIIYMPDAGGAVVRAPRQLVWVDRSGRETPTGAPNRAYSIARLSPDGTRVVMDARDDNDIWVWDLTRQTFTVVNRNDALDSSPLWMSDGRRLIWASTRAGGNPNLYMQSADGTGEAQRLTTAAVTHFPNSISADGRTILAFGAGASSMDIFSVTINGSESPLTPIVATPAAELDAELSPDGKWLAYHSNESGEDQVYVRAYPNVDTGRWQVSNAGGSRAAWSRDGRELFYLDRQEMLTSVQVQPATGGAFAASLPRRILNTAYVAGQTTLGLQVRAYDVSPDGQRFLMFKDLESPQAMAISPRMVVVLNWGEELKARLP